MIRYGTHGQQQTGVRCDWVPVNALNLWLISIYPEKYVAIHKISLRGSAYWCSLIKYNCLLSYCPMTRWQYNININICSIANTTHSVLLPVLSDTLPLLDLFFVRILSFVHRCLRSESPLINFMVRHGIRYGQMDSIIGRNVSQCSFRYNICTFDHVTSSVTLAQVHTARHFYLRCLNFCNAEMVLSIYRAAILIWQIYRRWLTIFVPVNYCTFISMHLCLFFFLTKS